MSTIAWSWGLAAVELERQAEDTVIIAGQGIEIADLPVAHHALKRLGLGQRRAREADIENAAHGISELVGDVRSPAPGPG